MSKAKTQREKKRQLGQFLTPSHIARDLVSNLTLTNADKVLEPSMGDGSFVLPLVERFLAMYSGSIQERLTEVLENNIYGVEFDTDLYRQCLENIERRWGFLPPKHNFINADFFRCNFLSSRDWSRKSSGATFGTIPFTYIVGNPPFGGTIDPTIQDELDRDYGFRNGEKIKKETYSFFIVKSVDLLSYGGKLQFICSDTFLTINTMRGLRRLLMSQGRVEIKSLKHFSDETDHPMVVLSFEKTGYSDAVVVDGKAIERKTIELTGNFSWRITDGLARYFGGPSLSDYMIATSGMTVGKNEFFVREIVDGKIIEPYQFEYFDDPITLDGEIARARLGKLSAKKKGEIKAREEAGATRRNVRIIERIHALEIRFPHSDYCYYNKGTNEIVYSRPTHVIYWKDDGEAVLTFKKNGNWYLHGIGGRPYFMRKGLTWQLIAQNLNMRYLPAGYVLDSGAPCAFLRRGIPQEELYFILGWTLTRLCNYLLKEVINHTKNIQSKDFERLPYPAWVDSRTKQEVISQIKQMITDARNGKRFTRDSAEIRDLEQKFAYRDEVSFMYQVKAIQGTLPLFERKAKFRGRHKRDRASTR